MKNDLNHRDTESAEMELPRKGAAHLEFAAANLIRGGMRGKTMAAAKKFRGYNYCRAEVEAAQKSGAKNPFRSDRAPKLTLRGVEL